MTSHDYSHGIQSKQISPASFFYVQNRSKGISKLNFTFKLNKPTYLFLSRLLLILLSAVDKGRSNDSVLYDIVSKKRVNVLSSYVPPIEDDLSIFNFYLQFIVNESILMYCTICATCKVIPAYSFDREFRSIQTRC